MPGEAVVKVGTLELTTAIGFDVGLFLLVAGSLVVLIRNLTALLADDAAATAADPDDADAEDGR